MDLISPYSAGFYGSLPSIQEAHERFTRGHGENHLQWLREFFVEHDMERRFGIFMPHHHFRLEDHEKLVIYGDSATPWGVRIQGDEAGPASQVGH